MMYPVGGYYAMPNPVEIRQLYAGTEAEKKSAAAVESNKDPTGPVLSASDEESESWARAKKAHELVVKLEAKLIIPHVVGKGDDLKAFLETEGAKGVKPVEKLTLRAKEVATMTGEIAILK